jgi:predicted nucleotide-binding protein (sugar kinase/HSP70/actin superfamily)
VGATEDGGGDRLVQALERAADRFLSLHVDRSEPRPLVAVVGELYLMLNAPFNRHIVRSVETIGGEVLLGTFMDWLYYVDWCHKDLAVLFHDRRRLWGALLSDAYQRRIDDRFQRAVQRALRHPRDTPVGKAMKRLSALYDPTLGTEAVLTMGRTLDMAGHGISGVINVLPFSCMPGTIVSCMGPKLRERMDGVPWLDVSFDGQRETNIVTRLEAFMHQAQQFQRRVRRSTHDRVKETAQSVAL